VDGEDGLTFAMPGATGPQGPAGGGSADIKTTEQDFGTEQVLYAEFSITDGDVTSASSIIPSLSAEAPAALRDGLAADGDEAEMEPMHLFAKDMTTGSFTLAAEATHGPLTGPYKFNYMVG
jgi:hypothetical protein